MSFLDTYFTAASHAFAAPPKRPILSLDYETYSAVDLAKTGASVYARDPSTEVLMLAYGWAGEPVRQWVPALGEEMPDDLWEWLNDPSITLGAWNAPFEMAITEHVLGLKLPVERWLDSMALAYSLALPGKLEKCGEVIGLGSDQRKSARGKSLIRKFCKPRAPTKTKPWTRADHTTDPEDWQEFLEYNRQDVVAEQAIYAKIKRYQMPDHEWRLWQLDQKINNAGIPINRKAVRAAVRTVRASTAHDTERMKEITGLSNPNSTAQLLPWLRENGYPYEDLKKGHVARAAKESALEADPFGVTSDEDVQRADRLVEVLNLRLRTAKASTKKFGALLVGTDLDSMLRNCHQFAGAGRTWRWSGRRFQPQNLSKPVKALEERVPECIADVEALDYEALASKYGRHMVMDVLSASVRPMVQAPKDHLLIDADLSAIENVTLGWLARDDKILRVFREGRDPYIDFATYMFGGTYAELWAEFKAGNKAKRTTAKPGVLGCGYMLSAGEAHENPRTGEIEATGLLGYGWNMGVQLTPEMAELSVRVFRETFEDVVQFWWDLDKAVRRVISTGKPQEVGYLKLDKRGPFMRIGLPSGRHLHYLFPKLEQRRVPWGGTKLQITYENMENGQWKRVSTHPGKLAENVTQAVARDILAHGMTLADRRGLDLRLHVHDQLVGVSPASDAEIDLRTLMDCMTTRPAWADDKLPLKAAGFCSPIFLKD